MPSMHLRTFCSRIFQHCPLLARHSHYADAAYAEFLAYKTRVPVRGAIMLNHDMDSVVLVKGWKKQAKWSFPRGKINKDEKDLDCAVREVYEETGFDIQAAGLVPENEEDAKYIEMSLREQHMRLYVFRSVPMDTYFEPRTRKEISKIDWYKLADLPTLKKEKQNINPNGEEALKGSNFYMVAPFIRQLKNWIKEQKRLDKQNNRPAPRKTVVLEEDTTEAEEEMPYIEAPSVDEVPIGFNNIEDPGHFSRLLSGLAGNSQRDIVESVNLPEVSTAQASTEDLAAELKRMLSVGGPVQAPVSQPLPQPIPQEKEAMANPLLNMLRGPQQPPQPGFVPPHTPADQILSTAQEAHTPHHHHPRAPQFQSMAPPPNFGFHSGHGQPLLQQQPHHPQGPRPFPQQQFPFGHGFSQHGPPQPRPPMHVPQSFPTHGNPASQRMAPPAMPQAPRPYQQTGDAQFAPSYPQSGQNNAIPAASRLPPPKLTSHALNLLSVFKSPAPQAAHPIHPIHMNRPSASGLEIPEAKPAVPPTQETPVEFSSPELAQPQAQKPRNQHQDTLLNLFRASSTPAAQQDHVAPPPQQKKEPVELSAQSSPHVGHMRKTSGNQHPVQEAQQAQQVHHKLSMRRLPNLDTTSPQNVKHSPGLTSATVSGPLNAPDFATVRKNQKPAELGTGASPNTEVSPPQQQVFHPTTILSRAAPRQQQHQHHRMAPPPPSQTPPVPVHTVNGKTAMEAPRPFHPLSILKRQEEGMPGENKPKPPPPMLPSAVPLLPKSQMVPPPPMLPGAVPLVPKNQTGPPPPYYQQKHSAHQRGNSFDRRDNAPADQKQTLLGLFTTKPKSISTTPTAGLSQARFPASTYIPPHNEQKQQLLNLFGPSNPTVSGIAQNHAHVGNIGSAPVSAFPGNASGVNSPVSPLPAHVAPVRSDSYNSAPTSAPNSVPLPNHSAGSGVSAVRGVFGGYGEGDSRSRISSITSIPGGEQGRLSRKGTATLAGNLEGGSGTQSPITPKDKNFLLDYLMDVAKEGDRNVNGGR